MSEQAKHTPKPETVMECKVKAGPMSPVNVLIERIEKRAEQARQVRDVLADDPVLAEKAVRIILGLSHNTLTRPLGREGPRMASRVRTFFEERDNPWATADEVAEGLCVTPGSVRSVIYSTRAKDAFMVSRTHPDRPQAKQWRLADARAAIAAAEPE